MVAGFEKPQKDDVLCGRGGKTNHHLGNITFRAIISDHHAQYLQCDRTDKTIMTIKLLEGFRAAGVRFLRKEPSSQLWVDVGDQLARTKISQALRDNTNPSNYATNLKTTANKDTGNRSKRPLAAPSTTDRNHKRVFPPEGIRDHDQPSAITSQIHTKLREVSPVPSIKVSAPSNVKDVKVSAAADCSSFMGNKTQSAPTSIASSCNYISPVDASLFEILEREKTEGNAEVVMSSSKRLTDPFVLPELPSNECLLRLPPIGKNLDNDDLLKSFSDGSTLIHDFTLAENTQSYPREVSPIPLPILPSLNDSINDCGNTRKAIPDEDFDEHFWAFGFSNSFVFESHDSPMFSRQDQTFDGSPDCPQSFGCKLSAFSEYNTPSKTDVSPA